MEGSITLRDARLELGQKIPVFTDIDGRMQIADNRAEMILTDGNVERLALRNGRVVIEPVIGGGAMAATDMEFEGDVADALAVGMTLGFAGGDNNTQSDLVATGRSDLDVKTSFPIRRKLKPDDIDFQVAGQVTNGDISGLPFGADARNANLQVDVRRDAFEISGNARIFDLLQMSNIAGRARVKHLKRTSIWARRVSYKISPILRAVLGSTASPVSILPASRWTGPRTFPCG